MRVELTNKIPPAGLLPPAVRPAQNNGVVPHTTQTCRLHAGEGEGEEGGGGEGVGVSCPWRCLEHHERVCVAESETHTSEMPWEVEGEAMTRQKPLILLSSMRCLRLRLAATVSATLSKYFPSSIEYTITRPLPGEEGEGVRVGRGLMCVSCPIILKIIPEYLAQP